MTGSPRKPRLRRAARPGGRGWGWCLPGRWGAAGREGGKRGAGMVPASRRAREGTPRRSAPRRASSAAGGAAPAPTLRRCRGAPGPVPAAASAFPAARSRASNAGGAGAASHPQGCSSQCGPPGQGFPAGPPRHARGFALEEPRGGPANASRSRRLPSALPGGAPHPLFQCPPLPPTSLGERMRVPSSAPPEACGTRVAPCCLAVCSPSCFHGPGLKIHFFPIALLEAVWRVLLAGLYEG